MPKGKYYGPDKYKGLRPSGKNKKGKADKYFGPNKLKGLVAAKKGSGSSSGTGSTAPKDTRSPYQIEADALAEKQYAGTLKELQMGRDTNKRTYDTEKVRRETALKNQLTSNNTAGQITGNTIAGLKGQALAQFAKTKADQDAISGLRAATEQAQNQGALTQFQEQLKARGIDPGLTNTITHGMQTRQEYSSKLDEIAGRAHSGQTELARQLYDLTTTQAAGQKNRAQAQAQAGAQSDLTSAYNTYAGKDAELAGTLAKTTLDKASTAAQTAMTLKKEAELAKQEKAQLALEYKMAGLKNSQEMAKLASSDYFKEAGLQLKASDLQLKGKKLDAEIEKWNRSGDTAEAKVLETIRSNMAKERVNEAKAGISYTAPKKKKGKPAPKSWLKPGSKVRQNTGR